MTAGCEVVLDDGLVTKRLVSPGYGWTVLGSADRAFLNEVRVNRMLTRRRPPVATPRLFGFDVRRRWMQFERIDGAPMGPKFPLTLEREEVDSLVRMALRLGLYRPRRRWFRRLELTPRLAQHVRAAVLTAGDADRIARAAEGLRFAFAHGDVTARNVVRRQPGGELVLIDWEWAGLYPVAYDLGLLWFSLVDVAGARAVVRDAIPPHLERSFLVSAAMVNVLHLHMWAESGRSHPNLPTHHRSMAALLAELGR